MEGDAKVVVREKITNCGGKRLGALEGKLLYKHSGCFMSQRYLHSTFRKMYTFKIQLRYCNLLQTTTKAKDYGKKSVFDLEILCRDYIPRWSVDSF